MKKIYSVSKLFALLLGAVLALNSCIRPDLGDCPRGNVRIVVSTDLEASSENSRASDDVEIDNLMLYLFDDKGTFVDSWQGGKYAGKPYETTFDLPVGDYQFVVWTNLGETYKINQQIGEGTQLSDLQLLLNYPENRVLTTDIPKLYHGILKEAQVKENENNHFTIYLSPDRYRLNFAVDGLPESFFEDSFDFRVTDNNTHYKFDNSIVADSENIDYLRTTKYDTDGSLTASITMLRLIKGRAPLFNLSSNSKANIHTANLIEMIEKAYSTNGKQVDFGKTFEFNITLRFNTKLDVEVSVNGWRYNPNETEL